MPIGANPLLNKLTHFANVDPNSASAVEALFNCTKSVPKGCDLLGDGDPAAEIILLMAGWAARYKLLGDGSRQILSILLPGDVFPIHLLPVGKMDHGIVSLTGCEIALASVSTFDGAVLHDPNLAQAFWWISIQEKAVLRAWIVNLGRRHARARIAHLLCETAERLKMAGLSSDDEFEFPLTQEQIADAEGLTPVHTNRVLQQLRRDGVIQLQEKRLRIIDAARLARIAGFDPAYLHPGGRLSTRNASTSERDIAPWNVSVH